MTLSEREVDFVWAFATSYAVNSPSLHKGDALRKGLQRGIEELLAFRGEAPVARISTISPTGHPPFYDAVFFAEEGDIVVTKQGA